MIGRQRTCSLVAIFAEPEFTGGKDDRVAQYQPSPARLRAETRCGAVEVKRQTAIRLRDPTRPSCVRFSCPNGVEKSELESAITSRPRLTCQPSAESI